MGSLWGFKAGSFTDLLFPYYTMITEWAYLIKLQHYKNERSSASWGCGLKNVIGQDLGLMFGASAGLLFAPLRNKRPSQKLLITMKLYGVVPSGLPSKDRRDQNARGDAKGPSDR